MKRRPNNEKRSAAFDRALEIMERNAKAPIKHSPTPAPSPALVALVEKSICDNGMEQNSRDFGMGLFITTDALHDAIAAALAGQQGDVAELRKAAQAVVDDSDMCGSELLHKILALKAALRGGE